MAWDDRSLDIVADGHPQLVGTAGRWKRCDSSEFFVSDDEPTPDANWADYGLPLKTIWVQVDSLSAPTAIEGLWIKIAEAADVAVWLPLPSGGSFSGDAGDVPFTPVGTIAATDTQAAVAEVATEAAAATAAAAAAAAAAIAVVQADVDAHESDAADAHDASAVSLLDTAGNFTATDTEGGMAELADRLDIIEAAPPGAHWRIITAWNGDHWCPLVDGSGVAIDAMV